MKFPVSYSEKEFKRILNKNATFIMIGNNIDGVVDFSFREFKDFQELSSELLGILSNLECCGEWDINLYQVKKPYKISKKHGYYKYPSNGKLVLTHNYMDCPIKEIKFNDKEIIFFGSLLDVSENWHDPTLDFLQYDLSIEIIKVQIV